MPKLICLCGMNKGEEYDLHEGIITLGRSENNNIRIYDKKSSRNHCQFRIDNEDIFLEDLNSTNGVKVNNILINNQKQLNFGDHIRIGQTVFLVSNRSIAGANVQFPEGTSSTLMKMHQNGASQLKNVMFEVTESSLFRKSVADKTRSNTGYLAFFNVKDH